MMLQQADGLFRWATSALVNSRTVEVGEGVGVGGGVGVTTIVGVGEGVGVGVTTIVGEGVGNGVGVGLAITVGEGDGVGVTTGVGVGNGVGVGLAITVGEGDGVGVTTGVGVGVGEGDDTGEGVIRTVTPRLQTRLFPRLIQVNSLFFATTTVPTFLHVAPARGVFADALDSEPNTKNEESKKTKTRPICEF
jgi:hypothetical protein